MSGVDRTITFFDPATRTILGEEIPIVGTKPPPNWWPWVLGLVALGGLYYVTRHERRGGTQRNPDGEIIDEAKRLFEGFHWGRPARRVRTMRADKPPRALVELGKLESVTYATTKGKQRAKWAHEFAEDGGRKPVLAMDADSKRLHIVGGSYTVEDRGIVG